jgi:hypothetical protein
MNEDRSSTNDRLFILGLLVNHIAAKQIVPHALNSVFEDTSKLVVSATQMVDYVL